MEKYLAAALLLFATTAHSTVVSSFRVICTDPSEFASTMENYGEKPLVRGVSNRVLEDVPFQALVVVFMNPTTRTFTIAEKVNESTICSISMGEEIEPLDEEGNALENQEQRTGT